MNSIYTGVSGMLASQQAVEVIANNVANLNTVAYKAGRVTFQETLVRTLADASPRGTNPMQIGTGVTVGSINPLMTQGSQRSTGRTLDLAVVGSGFFTLFDGVNNVYTRDGVIQLDAQNRLVASSSGMTLVGWQADLATGEINTDGPTTSALTIPLGITYAMPTTKVNFNGNLNATTAVGGTFTTTFNIFDSLGTEHQVAVEFEKTGDGTWSWTANSPDAAIGSTPGSGTITFDEYGHVTSGSADISLTLANPNGATNPLDVTMNLNGISQVDGESTVQVASQDGLAMGSLSNYAVESDGRIIGSFTNGASRVVGQIALARFSNPAGLRREGANLWQITANSGEAMIEPPTKGGGSIRSGYLELSNVDLASEFANLIVTQRGFQANSRSITTADDMLQDILQLKR